MQSPHNGDSPRFVAPAENRMMIEMMISTLELALSLQAF